MPSSSKKALVSFDFEENAMFLNLKEERNVSHQRKLVTILMKACLYPPETFIDKLPIIDLVANIHANSEYIVSVPQAVQDLVTLFGQLYREVNESEIPHYSEFEIARFNERMVILEYPIPEEDSHDTKCGLSPGD